jgi:hypothetical protein
MDRNYRFYGIITILVFTFIMLLGVSPVPPSQNLIVAVSSLDPQNMDPDAPPFRAQESEFDNSFESLHPKIYNAENTPRVIFERKPDMESQTYAHFAVQWADRDTLISYPLQKKVKVFRDLLVATAKVLESLQIEHWITFGTLLGSIRERNVIPFDDDTDIGMTFDGIRKLLYFATHGTLTFGNDTTFIVRTGMDSSIIPFKIVNVTNGLYLDIFQYHFVRQRGQKYLTIVGASDLRCRGCKNDQWTFPIDSLYPIQKRCEVAGNYYYCPRDSEKYLESWYGESWRTPIPD